MTVDVEIDKLVEVAAGFGTVPMLLTTEESGRPRAVAVSVDWDGGQARMRVGHRSLANVQRQPLVTLLYPAPPGERFALLVDAGVVAVEPDPVPVSDPEPERAGRRSAKPGGVVTVRATSGILHVVTKAPA
jgi:hypothetical protein